ncbi:hypothetical protein N8911_00760 [bacterium]|nr:hypothetical protein [bacterium]
MPIAIELVNLLIPKDVVAKKYLGGESQFIQDFNINDSNNRHSQDDELFSIAAMNADEYDIDALKSRGLEFNSEASSSIDFVICSRYGGFYWNVDWIEGNYMFIWHKRAAQSKIERAIHIETKMTMDKIAEMVEESPTFLDSF